MKELLRILRQNKLSSTMGVLFTILPLVVMASLSYVIYSNVATVHSFGAVEWSIVFLVSCFSMAFSITPTTYVALCCGFFLGLSAIFPLFVSYGVASSLAYGFIDWIDKGTFLQSLSSNKKLAKLNRSLSKNAFMGVVLARLSPVLPFGIMNVFLAINQVPIRTYLIAGGVGMLPRTLLAIWVGTQVSTLENALSEQKEMLPYQLGISGLTLVSIIGVYLYVNVLLKKQDHQYSE